MAAPLALELRARKPVTVAGEGIVLDLDHQIFADLQMETVELNETRTKIRVTRLSDQVSAELSGVNHRALHHPALFQAIGTSFQAPAGSQWTAKVKMFDYSRALPAGRYRIALSYRFGDDPSQTVMTNPVDIDVVPTRLTAISSHWFGGARPRYRLGSLWCSGDANRWFYQGASEHDPSVMRWAVDLDLRMMPEKAPKLAHLNTIFGMRFEQYAVWTDGGNAAWVQIASAGRLGEPASAPLGLAEGAALRLAEPALQRQTGGFFAVYTGQDAGGAAAVLLEVDDAGHSQTRRFPLPGAPPAQAFVLWRSEDPIEARLFAAADGSEEIVVTDLNSGQEPVKLTALAPISRLLLDQWRGEGVLYAIGARDDSATVSSFNAAAPQQPAAPVSTWRLQPLNLAMNQLVDAVVTADRPDLALLFSDGRALSVLHQGRSFRYPADQAWIGASRLVATPDGLFLMAHRGNSGFAAGLVGDPVERSHI